jgi:two-component system, NarL family, nitrate/nitrite response regulator NarL
LPCSNRCGDVMKALLPAMAPCGKPLLDEPESHELAIICEVRLYREGLVALMGARCERSVIGLSLAQAMQGGLARVAPEAVLVDAPLLQRVPQQQLGIAAGMQVLAFAVCEDDEDAVLGCAKQGACGFLSHDASLEELLNALETVRKGGIHCSPRLTRLFMLRAAGGAFSGPGAETLLALTVREREVLDLIAHGLSNKEIARRLNIENATVKNHVHHLLEKLHVRRRSQAAALQATHRLPAGPNRPSAEMQPN